MDYASFKLRWPREDISLHVYAHELSNYTFHWHEDEYEINIIINGKADYSCEGQLYLVEPDDVILINRNEGHGSFALEPDTITVSSKFSADCLQQYVTPGKGFLFDCISNKENRMNPEFFKIRYYVAQILDAAIKNEFHSELTAKASTQMLLATLLEFFPPSVISFMSSRDEAKNRAIQIITRYIDQNYARKITLDDLAKVSKYNRTYVSTFFKNNIGVNFHEYLSRVRFRHAIYELDTTNRNLTDIAVGNGFPDLKTFNYMFRDIFQMYPAEYRKKTRHIAPGATHGYHRFCYQNCEVLNEKIKEYLLLA